MDAFLISLGSVALAEMGDRTQLLSVMLAVRFRKPWPILGGILAATLLNHAAAGLIGSLFAKFLTPAILDAVVGVSLIAMAVWMLKPDRLEEDDGLAGQSSVFAATFVAFFMAEIGDKTQIATMALAAAYPNLVMVVAGSTLGLLLANGPVVFLGKIFASAVPLKILNRCAAVLFAVLGAVFLWDAVKAWG